MRKEIRIDTAELRPDRLEQAIEWVGSLGVEPKDVRAEFLIREGEDGYELHLSRFVRSESGGMRIDRARNEVVSEPLVVKLGKDKSWPSFFGEGMSDDMAVYRVFSLTEQLANAVRTLRRDHDRRRGMA